MADPFVAEIRIFPYTFAPQGWALCDGQLMPLAQNTALFSLIGTTYGGDGKSTFALPNLNGRAPMHHGQGPGLSLHDMGEVGGTETVTLLASEIPSHSHGVKASSGAGTTAIPGVDTTWAQPRYGRVSGKAYGATPDRTMGANSTGATGGGMPHNNMQPYLTFYFCIALQGLFPPRS